MADVTEHVDVRVTGRVQGVGFRHFTTQQARRLGIDGWVRNERDGSVRVVAEGPSEALDDFLTKLRQGPSTARVDDVQADTSRAAGEFSGFDVRYF